jgi:hypothetical protein
MKIMRRRWAVGVVAGLLLATCLPAHAIVLRYQPKVGEATKHKVSMSGTMLASVPGMGQVMQMELNGAVDYTEKALSETAETTRVETRLLGGSMTVKMEGQSQTEEMPTGRVVTDTDRRGRLVNLVEANVGGQNAMPDAMGPGSATWGSQFVALPEGTVEVNDSWSDTLKIPTAPIGPEIPLTVKSQLLELPTFQNRKCAKIRTSFEGPMNLDLSALGMPAEAGKGTMEASLQGDMILYYDYENSLQVYSEGTIAIDMNLSMTGPDAPPGGMNMQMQISVKATLEK